ncbi:MAG TPA: VWA domain-containing protein [Candidatus Acidoferrales bacterium]|jgi:VWFA-related protein|nr:VWA domain-containing protein [Candidatus Acidoferrales bacterium]
MARRRYFTSALLFAGLVAGSAIWMHAQDQQTPPNFHVVVDMVQLNVAVTDNKGNYVTGLKPSDFIITEDNIRQKIATFGEGVQAPKSVEQFASAESAPKEVQPNPNLEEAAPGEGSVDPLVGANVFILFDTSNYMYRGFAYAQDAIADFVRSLDGPDRIALYAYSRDLFRASLLTPDRNAVLRGVRATTAGDDAALYNALLLTLKDAGQYRGRKVIVVFSNGPDNDSLVPPEDVGELAQSEGIPIYMISTRAAKIEPISTAVFGRMAQATGGEAYFAKSWKDEQQAFAAIRNDLAHLYALNYYPQANPNLGWRAISVKLVGERLKKYHIRTRSGYRPLPARALTDTADIALSTSRETDTGAIRADADANARKKTQE